MHGLELAGVGLAAKVVIDHDQGRQAAGQFDGVAEWHYRGPRCAPNSGAIIAAKRSMSVFSETMSQVWAWVPGGKVKALAG